MPKESEQRKRMVLRAVVREYLETAEPVGSETIARKYDLGVSSATIRNDMVDLEEMGFLVQPHTSAGRIPTEEGYRFYVHEFVERRARSAKRWQDLASMVEQMERGREHAIQDFAKTLARLTGETVVIRTGRDRLLLTGVTNLVKKPESREADLVLTISTMIDNLERVLRDLEGRMSSDVEVFVGSENPFGSSLSSVVARYESEPTGMGIVGILGPTRMDYDENIALMRFIHDMLS